MKVGNIDSTGKQRTLACIWRSQTRNIKGLVGHAKDSKFTIKIIKNIMQTFFYVVIQRIEF